MTPSLVIIQAKKIEKNEQVSMETEENVGEEEKLGAVTIGLSILWCLFIFYIFL